MIRVMGADKESMIEADRDWLVVFNSMWALTFASFIFKYLTSVRPDEWLQGASDVGRLPSVIGSIGPYVIISALASLFLVGIPMRFGQNLLLKERRYAYRWETVALIAAFAAGCALIYSFNRYPLPS